MFVKKKVLFAISLVMAFIIARTAYAAEWVNISGTVYYENTPLSVMVLANGQHMFTDASDGRYQMDVPLNSNGEIMLYAFCDGLEPFKAVLEPWEAVNYDIDMFQATAGSNTMTVTVNQTPLTESGRVKLSGEVRSESGVPLCTMVLANGQHTFSCEGDGVYDLEVPLNSEGKITLFAFCDGMQPYKEEWNSSDLNIVYFPDKNLEAEIRRAINKETGDILGFDLLSLTYLDASSDFSSNDSQKIKNIEGIQYCTNLTSLILDLNLISDISALAGLTNLTSLALYHNRISDISALAGLTNLTSLNLYDNQISNISALAGLTNLTSLDLCSNRISNISALAGLTNLTSLILVYNNISDISAVAGLTNLTSLDIDINDISDISAVAGLTNLTSLDIGTNDISDISAVAGLTNLTSLDIDANDISDISAVAGLTNLTSLRLGDNQISDISAVAGLTNLTSLWLSNNQISDISAVAGLTNLKTLWIRYNQISDINVVLGLDNLRWLGLYGNSLSTTSCTVYIPQLESEGVLVNHNCP